MNTAGLMSVGQAAAWIKTGRYLALAADERVLAQLPKGNWIGGTIPYFMDRQGGRTSQSEVFVTPLEIAVEEPPLIRFYSTANLSKLARNVPENGYSLIIIPGFSEAHQSFAQHAPEYPEMYFRPLMGWIAGIHLDELGSRTPKVVHGQSGQVSDQMAVVMEVPLPAGKRALIDIVNPFQPGHGPALVFGAGGFSVDECEIDGKPGRLADHFLATGHDTRLPLVANYCGAKVNVSIKALDREKGRVDFYAPVFPGIVYRAAAPVEDYLRAFGSVLPQRATSPAYACNCVLNYLYSNLEGKSTAGMTGPMTFGEIAYQLLNQTLVYLDIQASE